ncbi:ATP-binding protein [Streptomyces canus]|uniref:ATP-binding protein n=1 Tax=Streptomyces canus TaxID=58343 RepID=UPI0036F17E60
MTGASETCWSTKAEDQLFDAMLVADELIANAIQHSSGAVLIRVDIYEFGAALGVVDRGADITAVPVRPSDSSVDEGTVAASGRGLFIVDSLANAGSAEDSSLIRSASTAEPRRQARCQPPGRPRCDHPRPCTGRS